MHVILHTACGCTREMEVSHAALYLEIPLERSWEGRRGGCQSCDPLPQFHSRVFEFRRLCPSGTWAHYYETDYRR